ncbi:sigma 54-interacting transcriptional regulator [Neobacillus sp.]|uniref:sigma 54-interacting transcriptional regulator n=1 Tax=Neobacillus sp. TaxID=2675273 RepID=UPI00289FFEAF|nr:sigma 54-interacting transcriptional regulator [Neobacillus sp.]
MRGKEYVLQIGFHDRLGLGYEVFSLLRQQNISLLGMEAKVSGKMTIKFKGITLEELNDFVLQLKKIKDIHTITFHGSMPHEQRERQLETILNSVSEGIIAINKDGVVTHINDVAIKIFHFTNNQVIGRHVKDLLETDIPIINTIQTGVPYKLKEVKIKKGNKNIHYLTSGVPIVNNDGEIIGAVATIKDYKQIEEIISKVDKRKPFSFDDIIFQSSRMKQVIETAAMVAKSKSTILLRGESGTGKELFAKAIQMESNRYEQPFVVINCAALPENLLESEFFGYEDGSFTGALKGGKKGLFEQADKGTLFLDEIGELSPHMQVRLLRVLQENTIRRIGGHKEVKIDVRIIAATHRNLEEMVKQDSFREDLYYRLNVVPIHIPPLRERREDLPLLINHLIGKICLKLGRSEIKLPNESMNYLTRQPWPGNVRQLENALERILNVVTHPEITVFDICQWINLETPQRLSSTEENVVSIHINLNKEFPQLKDIVDEVEKKVILQVLKTHDSSRKAGRVLGISNTTVLNKMKKYGIDYEQVQ